MNAMRSSHHGLATGSLARPCSHAYKLHKSSRGLCLSQAINGHSSNRASNGQAALEPPASGTQKWHMRRNRQGSPGTDAFQGSFEAQNISKDRTIKYSARSKPTVQPRQVGKPSQLVKAMFGNIRSQQLDQLQHLVENHIHAMDAEVLVAALVRLAKLRTSSAAQASVKQDMLSTLWLKLQPEIDTCSVQDVALTMWAAAKLQLRYPAAYRLCLQQFLQHLDSAPARHISNVIYALAAAPTHTIEVALQDVSVVVYKRLLPAFLQTVEAAAANTQDVSNTLWAVATLQLQPRTADLRSMLNTMLDQIEDAAPVSVSNTLWAMARLKYRPSQQLLLTLLQQLVQQAEYASAHDASNALWALANMPLPPSLQQRQQQLQESPGQAFEQGVVRLLEVAAAPARGRGTQREACGALWAAVKLDVAVAERQVVQVVQSVHKAARSGANVEPQDVSNLLWSLAKIHGQQQQLLLLEREDELQQQQQQQLKFPILQQGQLDDLLAALARTANAAKPQALANSLSAAAKLHLTVHHSTLVALVDAFLGKLDFAAPQEVANVLWALATLQQQQQQQGGSADALSAAPGPETVPPHITKLLVGRLVTQLEQSKSQEVANSLWAVAKLGQQVTPRQLRLLLSHLAAQLPAVPAQEIASTLWAVAMMCQASRQQLQQGQQQPAGQLQRLLAALADVPGGLQGLSQQTLCNALWAAAQLVPCMMPQWLLPQQQQQQQQERQQPCLEALMSKVPQLNLQAASVWAYALGQLGAVEAEQLLVAVLQQGLQLALNLQQNSSSSSSNSSSTRTVSVEMLNEVPGASNVAQALAIMCWSGAVIGLKQQRHVQLLRQLAAAYAQHWQEATFKDMCQVYMLHTWLKDLQQQQQQQQLEDEEAGQLKKQSLPPQQQQHTRRRRRLTQGNFAEVNLDAAGFGAATITARLQAGSSVGVDESSSQIAAAVGLEGCLNQEQLQQCHAAWLQQLDSGRAMSVSQLQQAVFAAAQQLPGLSGPPILESLSHDKLFSFLFHCSA